MHHGVLCPVRHFNRSRFHTLDLGLAVSFERRNAFWGDSNYGLPSTKIQTGRHSTRLLLLMVVLFRVCQNVYKPNTSTVIKPGSSLHWSTILYNEWCKSTGSYCNNCSTGRVSKASLPTAIYPCSLLWTTSNTPNLLLVTKTYHVVTLSTSTWTK